MGLVDEVWFRLATWIDIPTDLLPGDTALLAALAKHVVFVP